MDSQVRLYAIIARKTPVAVVFRRGPSKQVQLISWNTKEDSFEYGQWFKGRIYERRCDLSPAGDLLIYFAAKYREPRYSWTAISRPPYLTALALWQKGDGWGGGGQFVSESRIDLNHRPEEMVLAAGFSIPTRFKVRSLGERPGLGEDDPVWSARLMRDGWTLTSYPTGTKDDFGAKDYCIEFPDVALATRAVNAVGRKLLYARADFLVADEGLQLTELELIEPSLFFRHCRETAGRFADAVATLYHQNRS